MFNLVMIVVTAALCVVNANPLTYLNNEDILKPSGHHLETSDEGLRASPIHDDLTNFRRKRSVAEECEEMELCKLHARSGHSLLAAFQLYFVNKENARLWDHHQHSASDCDQRYRGCNGAGGGAGAGEGGEDAVDKQAKKIRLVDSNSIDDQPDTTDDDY